MTPHFDILHHIKMTSSHLNLHNSSQHVKKRNVYLASIWFETVLPEVRLRLLEQKNLCTVCQNDDLRRPTQKTRWRVVRAIFWHLHWPSVNIKQIIDVQRSMDPCVPHIFIYMCFSIGDSVRTADFTPCPVFTSWLYLPTQSSPEALLNSNHWSLHFTSSNIQNRTTVMTWGVWHDVCLCSFWSVLLREKISIYTK